MKLTGRLRSCSPNCSVAPAHPAVIWKAQILWYRCDAAIPAVHEWSTLLEAASSNSVNSWRSQSNSKVYQTRLSMAITVNKALGLQQLKDKLAVADAKATAAEQELAICRRQLEMLQESQRAGFSMPSRPDEENSSHQLHVQVRPYACQVTSLVPVRGLTMRSNQGAIACADSSIDSRER